MTGQSLLDRMELVNQELQLQSGEENVTKGLVALNVAQDYFESVVASRKGAMGGSTGTVTTTASTELTAFPTGLLRIDRLQLLDTNSLPKWDLDPIKRVGGHRSMGRWPLSVIIGQGTGEPVGYWTNGTSIYWNPLPSGTSTIRWYGFKAASDITASGTFAYPDIVSFPIATFAARLMKMGLDDNADDVGGLAKETFASTLDALASFDRDGASAFEYTEQHEA